MNENLKQAIAELLESGDTEGCDGLVVVGLKEFQRLQREFASIISGDEG